MSIRRSDDHDLTVFPTGPTAPEPQAPAAASSLSALEAGTTVHEFRILKLIGEGGFGIVYLAEDQSLDRTVALKEYMPSELAERAGGTSSVQVRSQRYAETFEAGMRSFINEARLLARFDHPSLLKVYRFFQANGTAYMAMPFYEGQTLKAILRERTEPPDERWLRRILYQLLDALEIIHRHECYHRDIAPDNVLMLQNDTPILLDFGAARRVIGDMTQNLTVILKPGYAPIEQYAEDPDMKQGPWTDIYALASVVHFALTRKPPPASIARAMNDRMEPLAQRLRGQYSEGLLATIDKALSLKPKDRPQSIASLRTMLLASDDGSASEELPPAAPLIGIEPVSPAMDTTGGRAGPATQPRVVTTPRSVAPEPEESTAAAVPPRGAFGAEPRSRLGIIGLAVAVPAALGFLWWLTSGSGEPPPAPTAEAPAPPKSASATPPARVEAPAAARPEAAPPARVATPAPTPTAPPPVAAVAPKPVPTPAKVVEAPPPKSQPQASAPPPPAAAKKSPEPPPKAAVVETKPFVAPPPSRAETPRLQRSEEVAEAPKPPPQQLARVEPKPEPAPPPQPAAKSEPPKSVPPAKAEAPKPPVEVARVEPPAPARPAAAAAEKALIGRYTGKMEMGGWPVIVTLDISSVQDGTVTATANQSAGPCAGSYRLTGTVRDDALRVRSTHAGGRGGDCSFGFRGSVQGTRLVGTTGNGVALEFSR